MSGTVIIGLTSIQTEQLRPLHRAAFEAHAADEPGMLIGQIVGNFLLAAFVPNEQAHSIQVALGNDGETIDRTDVHAKIASLAEQLEDVP